MFKIWQKTGWHFDILFNLENSLINTVKYQLCTTTLITNKQ